MKTVIAQSRTDLRRWVRNPRGIVINMVPPILLILLFLAINGAGIQTPVAVVALDHGPAATQVYHALSETTAFRLINVNESEAHQLLSGLKVAAVITIPQNFSAKVANHSQGTLFVQVDNLEADTTGDVQRGIGQAMLGYYSEQPGGNSTGVSLAYQYLNPRQVDIAEFELVNMLGIVLLLGTVNGGAMVAREWETQTIKEVLLSPTKRTSVILSEVVSVVVTTSLLAVAYVGILLAVGVLRAVSPLGWMILAGVILSGATFSGCIGIVLGNLIRKTLSTMVAAMMVAFVMFFAGGGIAPLQYYPSYAVAVARLIPETYLGQALQSSVLYANMSWPLQELVVLFAAVASALALTFLVAKKAMAPR